MSVGYVLLNIDPAHPAMHGIIRIVAKLEGELVVGSEVEIGYLHRAFEKSCEESTWNQAIIYTDRLNYVSSPINNVDAIQTPLLVLATTGDQIAPMALHTGRLLDALKARGKVFESHIYDNAPGGHVFTHGDTEEQRDAYRRMFEFFARYLKP